MNTTGMASGPLTKLAGRSGTSCAVGQPQIRQPAAAAAVEHQPQLQSGQLITQAEVGPETECQVAVGVPVDAGTRPGSRTPLRRSWRTSNISMIFSPAFNSVPWNSVSAVSGAAHVLHRRGPAQHLLDGAGQRCRDPPPAHPTDRGGAEAVRCRPTGCAGWSHHRR